jgi:hypothetical protein
MVESSHIGFEDKKPVFIYKNTFFVLSIYIMFQLWYNIKMIEMQKHIHHIRISTNLIII